jgi:Skp family chaperone for outer membrane proteins
MQKNRTLPQKLIFRGVIPALTLFTLLFTTCTKNDASEKAAATVPKIENGQNLKEKYYNKEEYNTELINYYKKENQNLQQRFNELRIEYDKLLEKERDANSWKPFESNKTFGVVQEHKIVYYLIILAMVNISSV